MASNVGALAFMGAGKAGGTYDMYTYVPYDWKSITAIRKRTPSTTRFTSDSKDYFESASLARTVDLICEGPIDGFADKSGETIKFFGNNRVSNLDFLKSIYLNDTEVVNERDGTFNFRVFDADFRRGEELQAILPDSYRTHGKTIMYNSQLFPANNGEAKTQLALNESSELVAEENLPKQDDGTTLNNTMIALEVSYTDPTVNKTLSGVIDKVHKQALHNKFKKLEKSLHPVVHTVTDPNVEVVSIAINIHALSQTLVGKRTTKTKGDDVHFLIYANNEGEPSIDNPPILEVTQEMAESFNPSHKFADHTGKPEDSGLEDTFILNNQTFSTYKRYNSGELIENDTGGYFVRRMQGLATSDYIFETIVHLPPNPKGKNRIIKIARLNADEEFRSKNDSRVATSLHSITEIVPCQLYHPNSAIIGTTVDSRAFASIPTRKYLLKLLKMKVPSNYIPDTKEYIGNWNGKFKTKGTITTATGDAFNGTSSNAYMVRSPMSVSQGGTLVKINTSNKRWGSGALNYPLSAGYGTNSHDAAPDPLVAGEFEEHKVLKIQDPYKYVSRVTTKGLRTATVAPIGTFGSSNFTIEFYMKTSASDLKKVYNIMSPNNTPDSTNGVEGVPKIIVASEQNAGLGWSIDTGVPDIGEMSIFPDEMDALLGTNNQIDYLDSGRLVGGAWRVEIGTKDSSDDDHVDLGKIRFRAYMPGGSVSVMTQTSDAFGQQVSLTPGWDDGLKYEIAADVTSTSNVADGNWHHIAVCRNGDTVSIFVDGSKQAESTVLSREIFGFKHLVGDDATKGEIQIGGTRTPYKAVGKKLYGTSFAGYLDEIMVSTKAKYIANFDATPDRLQDLIVNDVSTVFYINADNRDNNSTEIIDYVDAIIDTSYKYDEDAESTAAELQWTDNPAWILYDLITNNRYGLGKFGLNSNSVDKWNLYEIAKYCDEKVRTGLDSKYGPRKFKVIETSGKGGTSIPYEVSAGKSYIIIGDPSESDSLFANQKAFETEFPEFSTIALYDLNDEAAPVHKRIKYLRRNTSEDSRTSNERYSVDDDDRLISYQAADKDTAGYAIIEIQKLVSTEEAIRLEPGLESLIRTKKSLILNTKNKKESIASEKDVILSYIDNPENKDTRTARVFDVGSPINLTSTSGMAATEFYGSFDILEPRFSANLYIQTQADGYKLLNDICSIFRGVSYFANGKINAYFDKKKDPIINFTNANVKNGEFIYSGSSKAERFTTCLVRYVDKYEQYKPKIEYVEDPDGIVKYGIIEKELVAFGCVSRSQAKRLGKWFLFSSQYETEMVQFSAGKEAAYLRPGDVVNVIDKTRTQKRFGGRVVDFVSGENKIKIDLNLAEDYVGEEISIAVVNDFEFSDSLEEKVNRISLSEDDKIKQKTISDEEIANVRKSQIQTYKIKSVEPDTSLVPVENRIIELESEGGDHPENFGKIQVGSIFILTRKNADIKIQETLFKIINISQSNDLDYDIEARQYVSSKYDLSDNKLNHKIDLKTSRSAIQYSRPASPRGIVNAVLQPLKEGLERKLNISWDPVTPTPEKYKIVIDLKWASSGGSISGQNVSKKIVLEKLAKNASSQVQDTSVSVNIGDYSGEIEISIYTVDSEGNLDLIIW